VPFGATSRWRHYERTMPTSRVSPSDGLTRGHRAIDVLLVGPKSFLDVARPWIERRRAQGLSVALAPSSRSTKSSDGARADPRRCGI
jgi:hypothetical protein